MTLLRWIKRNPLAAAGFIYVLALLAVAVLGSIIAPYPDDAAGAIHLARRLSPPNSRFRLGTDDAGRDILSRLILGVRLSALTGFAVVAVAAGIGTVIGLVSGFAGRWIDEILMRVTDAFLAIPSLVLALAVAASLGPSLRNALLAIAIVWWPWYARLVRAQVLTVRRREFVEAARAVGASTIRILIRHILPNTSGPILVQASLDLGYVILTAASLGFLGIGAQPPAAEWGLMVSQGREYFPHWWWLATFPGLAIFSAVLGFNLVGDGLRDLFDPRTRRGGRGRLL